MRIVCGIWAAKGGKRPTASLALEIQLQPGLRMGRVWASDSFEEAVARRPNHPQMTSARPSQDSAAIGTSTSFRRSGPGVHGGS